MYWRKIRMRSNWKDWTCGHWRTEGCVLIWLKYSRVVPWFICCEYWYIFWVGQIQPHARPYPEVEEKSYGYWPQATFLHRKTHQCLESSRSICSRSSRNIEYLQIKTSKDSWQGRVILWTSYASLTLEAEPVPPGEASTDELTGDYSNIAKNSKKNNGLIGLPVSGETDVRVVVGRTGDVFLTEKLQNYNNSSFLAGCQKGSSITAGHLW